MEVKHRTHKLLKDRTEWSTQNSSFIYDNLNTFILISYPILLIVKTIGKVVFTKS